MRNSNRKTAQVTLEGEIIADSPYVLLGFVDGNKLKIENNEQVLLLNSEQIELLEKYMRKYESYSYSSNIPDKKL